VRCLWDWCCALLRSSGVAVEVSARSGARPGSLRPGRCISTGHGLQVAAGAVQPARGAFKVCITFYISTTHICQHIHVTTS
jgi:hypothetical protein